jgi:hypothetical protein
MRSCRGIPKMMQTLVVEDLAVSGMHHVVQSCMGGDLKLLNGWVGLLGCSSN